MANIKTTQKQWARAKEYFEAGLTLLAITEKTRISKTQLSKRSHVEGWQKGSEKERLIADAVAVGVAKGNLGETALSVHEEIVATRVRRLEWLNIQALKNVMEAMNSACHGQHEFKARGDTISKARDVLDPKNPGVAIQLNNGTAQPRTLDDFYGQADS